MTSTPEPATTPQKAAASTKPTHPLLVRLRAVSAYGWFAVLLLCGYGMIEIGGLGFAPGERVQVPGSVRQSPGGYRSYHFWHSGLHGGK